MTSIDWSNAPRWAQAVVASPHSNDLYWVEGWGRRNSKRQRVGVLQPDLNTCDMTSQDHAWRLVERRPVADEPKEPVTQWNGQGLPPVGTRCVFSLSRCTEWHKELRDGVEVEILAHYRPIGMNTVAVFAFPCPDGGGREVEQAVADRFSPLPTPEQIAAEERKKTIQEMLDVDQCGTLSRTKFCNLLYDAGYRKLPSA